MILGIFLPEAMRSHQSEPGSSKIVERNKRRGRQRTTDTCTEGKSDSVSATSSLSEQEQRSTASVSISHTSHEAASSDLTRDKDDATRLVRNQSSFRQGGCPSAGREAMLNEMANLASGGSSRVDSDHYAFFPSDPRGSLTIGVMPDDCRRILYHDGGQQVVTRYSTNNGLETTSHLFSRGYFPLSNRVSILQPTADIIRTEHQELMDTLGARAGGVHGSRRGESNSGRLGTTLDLYSHADSLDSARQRHILRVHEANRAFAAFHQLSSVFNPSYLAGTAVLRRPSADGINAIFTDPASRSHMTSTSHGPFLTTSTRSILPVDRTSSGGIISPQVALPNLLQPSDHSGIMNQTTEDEKASFPILTCSMSEHSFARLDQAGRLRPHDEDSAASRKLEGPPAKKTMKRKPGSRDRRFNSSTPISLVAAARSDNTEILELTGRSPLSLYVAKDTEHLSDYQCYLRQQIEIFEATPEDLQYNAQKMNKAVVLGQVGIRCKHCAHEDPWARTRGAVYYSASLGGLYQAGQNMSKNHLENECKAIPSHIREELLKKKVIKRRAAGGKKFWADSARSLGIFEDQYGLRFSKITREHCGNTMKPGDRRTTEITCEESLPE